MCPHCVTELNLRFWKNISRQIPKFPPNDEFVLGQLMHGLNRCQAIAWTNNSPICIRIYVRYLASTDNSRRNCGVHYQLSTRRWWTWPCRKIQMEYDRQDINAHAQYIWSPNPVVSMGFLNIIVRPRNYIHNWGVLLYQKQVSKAGTSNYILQHLRDVITCPCPWYMYLLLAQHSWVHVLLFFLIGRYQLIRAISMMTSSNGNIFRVTDLLCGEFTGLRWILRTKAQWRGALMSYLIFA